MDGQAAVCAVVEGVEDAGGDAAEAAVHGVGEGVVGAGAATGGGQGPGREGVQELFDVTGWVGHVVGAQEPPGSGEGSGGGVLEPDPSALA